MIGVEDPIILLTGGTRGITARVAEVFARLGPCTLILVGRTAPGTAPLDEDAARAAAKAKLEAEGTRATPKRIEDILRPLRVAEEARRTVVALEDLGAGVETHAIDLADEIEVQHLVEVTLARYGREAFRHESLGAVAAERPLASRLPQPPEYERFGAERVSSGFYREVLRFDTHFAPWVAALHRRLGLA